MKKINEKIGFVTLFVMFKDMKQFILCAKEELGTEQINDIINDSAVFEEFTPSVTRLESNTQRHKNRSNSMWSRLQIGLVSVCPTPELAIQSNPDKLFFVLNILNGVENTLNQANGKSTISENRSTI